MPQLKMEYLIVEGKRKLTMLYVAGERVYQKKAKLQKGIRLRCMFHKSCPGTALLDSTLERVFCDKKHSCRKDPDLMDELYFRNQLKRKAMAPEHMELQVHQVYDMVLKSFDEEKQLDARVPFKSVKAHMCRVRKKYKKENGISTNTSTAPEQSSSSSSKADFITCPICKEEIKGNPWINNPCGHGSCKSCSDSAFKESKVCVMCRKPIKTRIQFFIN